MGIDIYAHWIGQTREAKAKQSEAWLSTGLGGAGYLREAYHGEPYATKFLCAEAFETGEARIRAASPITGSLTPPSSSVPRRSRPARRASAPPCCGRDCCTCSTLSPSGSENSTNPPTRK